ncbi:site-specific DNA-methyltransferase [Flavobacterium sp. GSN2]|nr:site-specific DNA-methyltransferase [Flavobacterium sp. GSN2]
MPTLNWIGKDKIINHHQEVPYKVLDHEYGFSEDGKTETPTDSGNLIINGDNLEALKSLLPRYEGKVNCVYIDPPYNTGNESWVYNDNVNSPKIKKWLGKVVGKESEDLTRHDKWLCMMYPRLKLLHKLLAKDGAIFISIDDNEQANLKLMLDEIFGAGNYIGSFIVNSTPNARDYGHIGKMHEFCLFYAKKYFELSTNQLPDVEKSFKYVDEFGGYNIHPLYNSNVGFTPENRPNLYYPFYINPTKMVEAIFFEISLEKSDGLIEIFPPKSVKDNVQFVWRWGRPKSNENLNAEILGYKANNGEYRIVQKMRTTHKVIRSIIAEKTNTSRKGTAEVEKIFGEKTFSFPKPIKLLEDFIYVATDENSIILDSFAGSGTTAHAVLNLNKQDGGNRKFILIEMEDYAETITAERVKRVINGYGPPTPKGGEKTIEGTGGSFDYYTLGEPLFDEHNNLNETVGIEKIREYVWFAETRIPTPALPEGEGARTGKVYLGTHNDTAYYFIYEKDSLTTLDYESLADYVQQKAERYIIYADNCLLPETFMRAKNIEFKKIPRDITRF